jgi:hypothetical protein
MSSSPFIAHQKPIALIGSCFSDEMALHLKSAGFDCLSNPGGTIFHPVALANLLRWALDPKLELRQVKRDDVYLVWELSGSFYAMEQQELDQKLHVLRNELRDYLLASSHLFITFGTAYAYRLVTNQQLVGNCHKFPHKDFQKELSSIEEMSAVWLKLLQELEQFNPNLHLVFTVSPVRHLKDGQIENTRSKARLHLLIEELQSRFQGLSYFEAYEIMIDTLRDYSFYKEDQIHPNEKAIHEIWKALQSRFFSAPTLQLMAQWQQLQQASEHRLLHPESQASITYLRKAQAARTEFLAAHPEIRTY